MTNSENCYSDCSKKFFPESRTKISYLLWNHVPTEISKFESALYSMIQENVCTTILHELCGSSRNYRAQNEKEITKQINHSTSQEFDAFLLSVSSMMRLRPDQCLQTLQYKSLRSIRISKNAKINFKYIDIPAESSKYEFVNRSVDSDRKFISLWTRKHNCINEIFDALLEMVYCRAAMMDVRDHQMRLDIQSELWSSKGCLHYIAVLGGDHFGVISREDNIVNQVVNISGANKANTFSQVVAKCIQYKSINSNDLMDLILFLATDSYLSNSAGKDVQSAIKSTRIVNQLTDQQKSNFLLRLSKNIECASGSAELSAKAVAQEFLNQVQVNVDL